VRAKFPFGLTRTRLKQEYWTNNRRQHEIAKMFDVSTAYIAKKMKMWEIPVRGPRERTMKVPPVSKEYLETEYYNKGKTLVEIGKACGISKYRIQRAMRRHGIPRRPAGIRRVLEAVLTEDLLRREYWEYNKSLTEIAVMFDIDAVTVLSRMQAFGIPRRPFSEANKAQWTEEKRREKSQELQGLWQTQEYRNRMSGPNSPVWNGGTSNHPYPFEFDAALKRRIRKRDNYTCAVCRMSAKSVHHIDYDKHNLDEDNLITLCRHCHSETNHRRELWSGVLMEIRAIDLAIVAELHT